MGGNIVTGWRIFAKKSQSFYIYDVCLRWLMGFAEKSGCQEEVRVGITKYDKHLCISSIYIWDMIDTQAIRQNKNGT